MFDTHTHTVNTHPEQWAVNAVALGEQLGIRCLGQGLLSRGIEGGEALYIHGEGGNICDVATRTN